MGGNQERNEVNIFWAFPDFKTNREFLGGVNCVEPEVAFPLPSQYIFFTKNLHQMIQLVASQRITSCRNSKDIFSANPAKQHISHFSFSLITITFLNAFCKKEKKSFFGVFFYVKFLSWRWCWCVNKMTNITYGCDSHAFTRDSCTYFKGTTVLQLHMIAACLYTSDLIAKRLWGWRIIICSSLRQLIDWRRVL